MKRVCFFLKLHEGVSKNRFFYPPNHPILIGFSIIFTIHFGGFPPIFGNTHEAKMTWHHHPLIYEISRGA